MHILHMFDGAFSLEAAHIWKLTTESKNILLSQGYQTWKRADGVSGGSGTWNNMVFWPWQHIQFSTMLKMCNIAQKMRVQCIYRSSSDDLYHLGQACGDYNTHDSEIMLWLALILRLHSTPFSVYFNHDFYYANYQQLERHIILINFFR